MEDFGRSGGTRRDEVKIQRWHVCVCDRRSKPRLLLDYVELTSSAAVGSNSRCYSNHKGRPCRLGYQTDSNQTMQ